VSTRRPTESTIVVDIGGTKMLAARAAAVVSGEVAHAATPRDGDALVTAIVELVRSVEAHPDRVVIASPGVIDARTGIVTDAANLGVGTLPSRSDLESALDAPVVVVGDVEAGAVAEFGAQPRDGDDGIYLTVSTGIGTGLVLDGVLRDRSGVGEFGHVPVAAAAGLICGCGGTGCLETIASGLGITRRAVLLAAGSSALAARVASAPELTARDVSAFAADGDPVARQVLDEGVDALAMALTGLVRIMAPQTIVVGGGFALGTGLGERLEQAMRPYWKGSRLPVEARIVSAAFGRRSVLVGAGLIAGSDHPDHLMPRELASSTWGRLLLAGADVV
jgi:predicted NBD/HSP70 family sugar kinase